MKKKKFNPNEPVIVTDRFEGVNTQWASERIGRWVERNGIRVSRTKIDRLILPDPTEVIQGRLREGAIVVEDPHCALYQVGERKMYLFKKER